MPTIPLPSAILQSTVVLPLCADAFVPKVQTQAPLAVRTDIGSVTAEVSAFAVAEALSLLEPMTGEGSDMSREPESVGDVDAGLEGEEHLNMEPSKTGTRKTSRSKDVE